MDAKYINVGAIDTLLSHSDLSDAEFLNRCTTISTPRELAMIRRAESALIEQIADLSQALKVPPEVLTDTTGETFETYFLTHRFWRQSIALTTNGSTKRSLSITTLLATQVVKS